MRLYRLYLKSWSNHTIGRADYDADDEANALAIAAGIFDACSDIAAGLEVWNGPEMIFSSKQSTLPDKTADLTGHQKRLITNTEIKLRDSGWQISKSRKLIEAIEKGGGLSTPAASQADEQLGEALGDSIVPREAVKTAGPATDLENFIAGIESSALRAVAKHWSDVRGHKLMPAWNDISSSVLAPHFKMLWSFTFDRRKGEFAGRLAGRQVKEWFGTSFSGHKLEDMHYPPQVLTEAHALLTKLVTIPAVGRTRGLLARIGEHTVTGERIALPLATDGTHADGILGASDYSSPFVPGTIELIYENIVWCPISVTAVPADN